MNAIQITPERLESKRKELEERGIHIEGNEGVISQAGCKIAYKYNGQLLQLIIQSKPFYITTRLIEERLEAFFA